VRSVSNCFAFSQKLQAAFSFENQTTSGTAKSMRGTWQKISEQMTEDSDQNQKNPGKNAA